MSSPASLPVPVESVETLKKRIESRPSLEWKPGVLEDGLGVRAFDKSFDDHFEINSDVIAQALEGTFHECCASFPQKKMQPEAWGISVGLLWKLWMYVREDLLGYAAAHELDSQRNHCCLVSPCLWNHCCDQSCTCANPGNGGSSAENLQTMKADMHLVVQRYVLPWTKSFDAGLALVLNAGGIAWSRKSADVFCMATTFVSHSWSEAFEDFALTLHRLLDEEAVVWICSFALWQHGNVSASLSSLDTCPFAVSMRAAHRVLVLTDHSADTLERCWVVFEAALAHELGKDYNICLPDDGDAKSWRIVGRKLEHLDVEACKASNIRDKEEILRYIRKQHGGIYALNGNVRKLARQAMERSELMAAAVAGDIQRIQSASLQELLTWRNIRGRTVTHVAAACSQVAAMVKVLHLTNFAHLNLLDEDSRSPLGVAVESGQVASVLALLAMRAEIELRAPGTHQTVLHLAAIRGHPDITQAVVDMKADMEAETVYYGRPGHRPLSIACNEGNEKIVRLLLECRANMEARTSTGAAPLHVAAWTGHAQAAAALLTGKAEVNITTQDMFQRTPLSLALMNGHSTMVGLLLGAKAEIGLTDDGEDLDLMTPANTTRSRTRRRLKKYTRKDSRREAEMMILKHESSGSFRDKMCDTCNSSGRSDGDEHDDCVDADGPLSVCATSSRRSSRSVTFEDNPNVTFFPGSSSSSSSSDTEEGFVMMEDSFETLSAETMRSGPAWQLHTVLLCTLFALTFGVALGRWQAR